MSNRGSGPKRHLVCHPGTWSLSLLALNHKYKYKYKNNYKYKYKGLLAPGLSSLLTKTHQHLITFLTLGWSAAKSKSKKHQTRCLHSAFWELDNTPDAP